MNTKITMPFLTCLVLMCPALRAQQSSISDSDVRYGMNSQLTETLATEGGAAVAADPSGSGTAAENANDSQWHVAVSPYLWLPGVHGTVGAFDRDAGFKASASDLLSHFRFGLLGATEARRNRVLTNVDLMFMRLADDKAVPFSLLSG